MNDKHVDEWLMVEMVRPSQQFIRKVVLSQEQYEKVLKINQAYHHNTTLTFTDVQKALTYVEELKDSIRSNAE